MVTETPLPASATPPPRKAALIAPIGVAVNAPPTAPLPIAVA